MESKIRPLGSSSGVIIPKDLLEAVGLHEGDNIEITVQGDGIKLFLRKK